MSYQVTEEARQQVLRALLAQAKQRQQIAEAQHSILKDYSDLMVFSNMRVLRPSG